MSDKNEILVLREKIRQLINKYELVKNENNFNKKKIESLNLELSECKSNFKDTEKKLELLKIAKSVSGKEDEVHDAKIKINRMVREIDKCIALLNQ